MPYVRENGVEQQAVFRVSHLPDRERLPTVLSRSARKYSRPDRGTASSAGVDSRDPDAAYRRPTEPLDGGTNDTPLSTEPAHLFVLVRTDRPRAATTGRDELSMATSA